MLVICMLLHLFKYHTQPWFCGLVLFSPICQTIEVSCDNQGYGLELFGFLQMGNSEALTKGIWSI